LALNHRPAIKCYPPPIKDSGSVSKGLSVQKCELIKKTAEAANVDWDGKGHLEGFSWLTVCKDIVF